MTPRLRRRQGGVTLVELLMALAIAALVLAPLAAMLNSSVLAGTGNADRAALEQDLNFALERVAAAARATPRKVLNPQDTMVADSGGWLDGSRFRVNGSGQFIEVRDGVDSVLAGPGVTFGIKARPVGDDATIVEATLRLERGAEVVQGSVAVRMGGPRT